MSYNVAKHQEKLHKINEFNIFTANPDTDVDNGEEPVYDFIKELIAISDNTPYTETEWKAIDTYFTMNLEEDEDVDVNWCYRDDISCSMLPEHKYLDTTTHEHFVELALKARAKAINHKHRFVVVDIALDCLLTYKYLTMLKQHDYRLEYFIDYAEALTIALSNIDSAFYSLL